MKWLLSSFIDKKTKALVQGYEAKAGRTRLRALPTYLDKERGASERPALNGYGRNKYSPEKKLLRQPLQPF